MQHPGTDIGSSDTYYGGGEMDCVRAYPTDVWDCTVPKPWDPYLWGNPASYVQADDRNN